MNKIRDIGMKYLAFGLLKLINLISLDFNFINNIFYT